jgi:hypothetical protein
MINMSIHRNTVLATWLQLANYISHWKQFQSASDKMKRMDIYWMKSSKCVEGKYLEWLLGYTWTYMEEYGALNWAQSTKGNTNQAVGCRTVYKCTFLPHGSTDFGCQQGLGRSWSKYDKDLMVYWITRMLTGLFRQKLLFLAMKALVASVFVRNLTSTTLMGSGVPGLFSSHQWDQTRMNGGIQIL